MDPNSPNKNKGTTTPTKSSNQTRPKTPPSSSSSSPSREYIRSYTCTFCEKGFSNAQALGGHMNIHRRDRARLRNLDDSDLPARRASPTIITWQPADVRPSDDQLDPRVQFLLFAGNDPGGVPPGEEVDLELRLGLEPSTSSSSPHKGP